MIKVAVKIKVKEHPIQLPVENRELIGEKYAIMAGGFRAGVYYAKRGELALEKIPTWLPELSRQVREEVEKVLKVKVKETTIYR